MLWRMRGKQKSFLKRIRRIWIFGIGQGCIGIGWYSYKLNMERGKLSERKGVENYNGGGDSEYMEKFNEKMGYINDVLYD